MVNVFIGSLAILLTIASYVFAKWLNKKIPSPWTLPVLIATLITVVTLFVFKIPYQVYMIGGDWIGELLGPAVVALAYPLYTQRNIIKQMAVPIITGVFTGAVVGISTGILFAKWIGFSDLIIYSISPKSVTIPVAMDIASSLGGAAPLAVVFVMIAGIGGGVMSSFIFKWGKISNNIGRGIGIGSASHAIGIAKAMESSQLEGSVSTVAMILSAIVASLLAPLLAILWL